MSNSLLEKMKKSSTIKESNVLTESEVFNNKDTIVTDIPALNIALSGELDGGFGPGTTMWAGPSKHGKSLMSLLMAKAYMDKYSDSILLFYDSEFGSPKSYFTSLGIDPERILHTPITDIEQLKFDIMQQINNIDRKDKIIIVIDSIGNLASKKEVDDAIEGKSTADMSRAKQLKSLFRMITPHLTLKNIPLIAINHTYKTMELYAKDVVGGGTGSYYSSDNIYIMGRQQEKDGTDVTGYNFVINVEKSRHTKEKSKIPLSLNFDHGINKYSGLLELALESGDVIKPSNGWYQLVDKETGEMIGGKVRAAETERADFLGVVLARKSFKDFVSNKYKLSKVQMVTDKEIEEALSNGSS